jgi:hypothetical protein
MNSEAPYPLSAGNVLSNHKFHNSTELILLAQKADDT